MSEILKPFESILLSTLHFFYGLVKDFGGYGTAIILLTLTVRIVLLPFTIAQIRSALEMQRVQPFLKEIQEKYKNDKEKLQKEMLALFAEHKINPVGGCLPLLLQLPVFFALYYTIIGDPALAGQQFLWLDDLKKPDPIYLLPLLTVVTTFLSFKVTALDPKQMQLFMLLTLPLGWISVSFPSGVLIYWVTTNAWTIGQSYIMYAEVRHEKRMKLEAEEQERLAKLEAKQTKKEKKRKKKAGEEA